MAQIKKWLIIYIVVICFLSCSIHRSKSHLSETNSIVVWFKKGWVEHSMPVSCSFIFERVLDRKADTIIKIRNKDFYSIKKAMKKAKTITQNGYCDAKMFVWADMMKFCICDFNRVYNDKDEQVSFDLSVIYFIRCKSGYYNYFEKEDLLYFEEIKRFGIPADYKYAFSNIKRPFRIKPSSKIVFIRSDDN